MPELPSLDIVRRSASTQIAPRIRAEATPEVAKLIDVSKCIGCKACQVACSEWNNVRSPIGEFDGSLQNPPDLAADVWTLMRFTEYENPDGDLEWLIRKDGCMHCADPGCLKACPSPGAIVQYANGIVDFNQANCIGCGYCEKGCPFNIPRYGVEDRKAYKCTLCSDRVAVGLEPACAKACPTGAIMFGSKVDMIEQASERVEDLKSRGFANAGLYDPQGVGGTHVMYVLHHADQPQLYQGLPADPTISPLVQVWKGSAKVIGLAAMGLAAVGGFLHYLTVGPNEVPEKAEDAAKAMRDEDQRKRTQKWTNPSSPNPYTSDDTRHSSG
jgi:formate dehydrogenase iron-sulfur subunit